MSREAPVLNHLLLCVLPNGRRCGAAIDVDLLVQSILIPAFLQPVLPVCGLNVENGVSSASSLSRDHLTRGIGRGSALGKRALEEGPTSRRGAVLLGTTSLHDVNRGPETCPTGRLPGVCLSEGLDAAAKRQIDELVTARIRLRKGETLFRTGDHSRRSMRSAPDPARPCRCRSTDRIKSPATTCPAR